MVTSVHRPHSRMSRQHTKFMVRAMKGLAMDASPRDTWSSSSSASAICWRARSQDSAASACLVLPLLVGFFLSFFPSFACFASLLALFLSALSSFCSFRAVPCASLFFLSMSGALTMDTPTWALLSAPTSFVPSPHMSVVCPASSNAATTASFCDGACRAKTHTCGTTRASMRRTAGSTRRSSAPGRASCAARRASMPLPCAAREGDRWTPLARQGRTAPAVWRQTRGSSRLSRRPPPPPRARTPPPPAARSSPAAPPPPP
mmetsp:Transcript_18130/g.36161  ORF Transcript_18130/g.36161 Transcript_18130/m.36161 type:complete len:261 (+) Transcript_18130:753-1535(+)